MLTDRLQPPEVIVSFEQRPYQLGETINLKVEILPKRNLSIREGHIDLVCVEERIEVDTGIIPPEPPAQRGMPLDVRENLGHLGYSPSLEMGTESEVIAEHSQNEYVHSSTVFLKDAELMNGQKSTCDVQLRIRPEAHHRTNPDATVTWKLITTIDVVNARDVRDQQPIMVVQSG